MRALPVALLCALALPTAAPAAIIYNSRIPFAQGFFIIAEPDETDSGIELPGFPTEREFETRVGDTITFVGTDRYVTAFSTQLWSFTTPATPVSADVELTLYQNNAGLPGASIWSGVIGGVTLSGNTPVEVVFAPHIAVPNSICFGIALSNVSATRVFGIVSSNNVTNGSSTNGILLQDTATQQWRFENYGISAFNHVDARVTAVPAAPGAFVLLGGLAIGRRRR